MNFWCYAPVFKGGSGVALCDVKKIVKIIGFANRKNKNCDISSLRLTHDWGKLVLRKMSNAGSHFGIAELLFKCCRCTLGVNQSFSINCTPIKAEWGNFYIEIAHSGVQTINCLNKDPALIRIQTAFLPMPRMDRY